MLLDYVGNLLHALDEPDLKAINRKRILNLSFYLFCG